MRRAASALRGYIVLVIRAIDIEGAFVIAGTAVLAAAAGFIHPAGPGLVVGTVLLACGLAIARPPKTRP